MAPVAGSRSGVAGAVRRLVAAGALIAFLIPSAAFAFTIHPAVTVRGADVEFYAGHLVLDAKGDATLDDGVVHVSADRILVDLSKNRYLAIGDVTIVSAQSSTPVGAGAALGVDLSTHEGTLVAIVPTPASFALNGAAVMPLSVPVAPSSPTPSPAVAASASPAPQASAAPSPSASTEPLALVDLEGEQPFARGTVATAHLGADVRLGSSRVIVPGGKDVFIPSYVYTFSSDVGYSQSNVAGGGEDVPIYFGSTRDSVTGAHFTYNSVSKVGVGLDHRIVDGDKAYLLFSLAPLNGPTKNANFTWQEQINSHASQNVNAFAATGAGSSWRYDAIDSLHRSYVDLTASTALGFNDEAVTWQGAYEPLGAGWLGDLFNFHLLSQYGRSQSYAPDELPLYSTSLETVLQAPFLPMGPTSSLSLQADWRETFDDLPHREFAATYTTTLQHRWNPYVTTSLSDREMPTVDYFPSDDFGTRSYISLVDGTLSYTNGEPFAIRLDLTHAAAASAPPGIAVQPWFASFDVRFRVSSSLAFDVSRSYGFGYNGQRFGGLGFQIFP